MEYKVRADAAVIHDALVAAAGENASSTQYFSFETTLTAVATDGSGATVSVPVKFSNVYFDQVGTAIVCKMYPQPYTTIEFNLPGAYKQAVMESTVKRFGSGINLFAGTSSSSNSSASAGSTYTTISDNLFNSVTPAKDPSSGLTYVILKSSGTNYTGLPVTIKYLDIFFEASK